MYASGPAPTAPRKVPSPAWIVSMRVLFPLLAIGSMGLLLWAPLVRLACVRRRAADWWTAAAGFVLVCVLLPIIGRDGSEADPNGVDYVCIPLLLLAMAGACVYYLVADVRHHARLTGKGAGLPQPPYAYATTVPLTAQPYGPPHPLPPTRCPQPGDLPQTPRPQPAPRPHTPPPPPHRIDQVRAELDELSDYLRKEEGR